MDALGGYGSSDSSDNDSGDDKPKSALSGLLANLSDASDDEDDAHTAAAAAAPTDATTDNEGNEANEPPQKKMRRGGEELDSTYHDSISRPQHHVLPPPKVLASTNNTDDLNTETAPYQSLILSTKDYTSQLRQTLTQQLKSQASEMPGTQQKRLADKLKLLQETFQKNDNSAHQSTSSSSNTTSSTSFAAHLKSKQEFGNPHLLKDIIDHFEITPLDPKQFKPFEFFDRLQISEEKARIAAANYGAGN
eukprot:scaffold33836_cov239-Skeletonema_dohrnii-CCMP3373.AAC.1